MAKYAFFDLAKTIVNGYFVGKFNLFFTRNYATHLYQEVIDETILLEKQLHLKQIDYNKLVHKVYARFCSLLEGKSISEISKLSMLFRKANNFPIYRYVIPLFKYLIKNGFQIIIITADLEIIVKPYLDKLPKPFKVHPSKMSYKNGLFTGKLSYLQNDKYKLLTIQEIEKRNPSNLTIAFGDSLGDIPMLRASDLGFLIQPNTEFIPKKELKSLTIVNNADSKETPDFIINKIREIEKRN